jgi:hypothetical protein
MNHDIVNIQLQRMGFDVDFVPGYATLFSYEGLTCFYEWDDDDDDFLRLSLPKIYDVTDDNRALLLEIINDVNQTVKYTKTCIYQDSVWIYYEQYRVTQEQLEEQLEQAIRALQATLFEFHHFIDGNNEAQSDASPEKGGEA